MKITIEFYISELAYNHFHILRLFDVLQNVPFNTSETMRDYLQTWYIRVASRVAKQFKTQDPRKLGNIRKVSKLHTMIPQYAAAKTTFGQAQQKSLEKQKLNFSRIAPLQVKTRVSLKHFVTDCRFQISASTNNFNFLKKICHKNNTFV